MTPALDDLDALLTAPGQMFEIAEAHVNGIRVPVWKNARDAGRSLTAIPM